MNGWGWVALGLAFIGVVVGVIFFVLRRRKKNASNDPDAVMRAARRAIGQSAWDQRRRAKGTIRGKGQGGSESLAMDSALGSDSGGAP